MADTAADAPATNSSSLLMGLAILKVNAEREQNSFLDSFFPFVVQGITDTNCAAPSWNEISRAVYKRFHLKLPAGVVQHIIYRMQSRKKLTRSSDGTIELAADVADTNRFKSQTKQFLRRHARFLEDFREFCAGKGVVVSNEIAEDELLTFVEQHGVDLLSEEYEDVSPRQMADDRTPPNDPRVHYLLPRFVQKSIDDGSDHGDHVLNLVKGMWIASSLYEADEQGNINRPFVDTTVYLDTKVLLRALGFAGPELQEATLPTIRLSKSASARMAVFEHTVDEIRGVLIATARSSLEGRPADPIYEVNRWHLESNGVTVDDLLRAADELEERLSEIDVAVDEKPPPEVSLTIDEVHLESKLQEAMPGLGQRARERDLDSLTAIYRLRQGKQLARLEICRAIFATTSGGLCRVARKEFGDADVESVPLAIPDHHLQTIAWLKHPLPSPDLPKQVVIAHCYSAIQPSDLLWSKYLAKIKSLTEQGTYDETDYLWLKYSRDARQAMMDRTLGVSASLTEETLSQILDQRYESIKAPFEHELDRYRSELANQQEKMQELIDRIELQEARVRNAEEKLQDEKRARERAENKLRGAGKHARRHGEKSNVEKLVDVPLEDSEDRSEPTLKTVPGSSEKSPAEEPLRPVLNLFNSVVNVIIFLPAVTAAIVILGAVLAIMPDDTVGRSLLPDVALVQPGKGILLGIAAILTLLSLLFGWSLISMVTSVRAKANGWASKKLGIEPSSQNAG